MGIVRLVSLVRAALRGIRCSSVGPPAARSGRSGRAARSPLRRGRSARRRGTRPGASLRPRERCACWRPGASAWMRPGLVWIPVAVMPRAVRPASVDRQPMAQAEVKIAPRRRDADRTSQRAEQVGRRGRGADLAGLDARSGSRRRGSGSPSRTRSRTSPCTCAAVTLGAAGSECREQQQADAHRASPTTGNALYRPVRVMMSPETIVLIALAPSSGSVSSPAPVALAPVTSCR